MVDDNVYCSFGNCAKKKECKRALDNYKKGDIKGTPLQLDGYFCVVNGFNKFIKMEDKQ